MIQVTLSFSSAAEAASALGRLAGETVSAAVEGFARGSNTIAPVDVPDAGAAERPVVHLPGLTPGKTVSADVEFNPFAAAAAAPETAAAPIPPIVPASATPPSVDSTGLPWDARIHASNKATITSGAWRAKKGLNDEAMVKRIEQELRASVAAPAASTLPGSVASVAPPPAAPAVTPPAPPVVASTPPTLASPVPAPPVPVSTPPAPPALPSPTPPTGIASGGETFGAFMARMAPRVTADPVRNTALMSQALSAVGLTTVAQLAPRPDLIATVSATFEALAAS